MNYTQNIDMTRKEKGHDESPAIISDHAFEPKDEWWSLCRHCGFAMSSHAETTVDAEDHIAPRAVRIEYYGDDEDD